MRNNIFKICIFITFFTSIFTFSSLAQNSEPEDSECNSIKLNEIMPNPKGPDNGNEWLELYNCFDEEQDLQDYIIEDKSGNQEFLEDIIEANGFLIIYPDISLNQTDEEIYLYNADGQLIDEFQYSSSHEDKSFSRIIDGIGEWTEDLPPTPGETNQIIYNHEIQINEIYPSPKEEETEYIELYNYSNESINLQNWKIADKTKIITLEDELVINAKEYIVLTDEIETITLNNSGDEISLFDPANNLVDIFEYPTTSKGISNIIDHNGDIKQTLKSTPGEENIFIDPDDCFYKAISIELADIQDLSPDDNSNYIVSGILTTHIGQIYTNRAYIQNENAGLQIYIDKNIEFNQNIGDEIKFCGQISSYYSEPSFKVQDFQYISSNNNFLINKNFSLDNVGKKTEITGVISKKTSSYLILIDELTNEEIKISRTKNVDYKSLSKGDLIKVTGIISIRGLDESDEAKLRLVVYEQNSVSVIKKYEKKKSKTKKITQIKGDYINKRPTNLNIPQYKQNDSIQIDLAVKVKKEPTEKQRLQIKILQLVSGTSSTTSLSAILLLLKKTIK